MKHLKPFFESKQVGVVYHYTSLHNLIKILKDNTLSGGKIAYRNTFDDITKPLYLTGVSFTRNKNFHDNENRTITSMQCRLVIDGDKLSNNYKIRQFNQFGIYKSDPTREIYTPHNVRETESEELVECKEILNIKNYIIRIDIIKEPTYKDDIEELSKLYSGEINFIYNK